MIETLERINLRFFELFGQLYENVEFLSSESYKYMEQALFTQYKVEVEKFLLDKKVEDKKDVYELKKRLKTLTPKGVLFFKNQAKKVTNLKLEQEFKEYFNDMRDCIVSEKENENF